VDRDATLFRKYVDELRRGRKGTVFSGTKGSSLLDSENLVNQLSPTTRAAVMMQSQEDLIPLMRSEGSEGPSQPSGANDLEAVVEM
jgi:hypothetical protein